MLTSHTQVKGQAIDVVKPLKFLLALLKTSVHKASFVIVLLPLKTKHNHVNWSRAQEDQVFYSLVICHILVHYATCWQFWGLKSSLYEIPETCKINLSCIFEHLPAPFWLPCVPPEIVLKLHILKQSQTVVIFKVNLSELISFP